MTDNQDNLGIKVPPPLIYMVPLILRCFSTGGRTSLSCLAEQHEA